MVDGVNFNLFAGKVFSEQEIAKLDSNKDGKVSYEEFSADVSWISGQSDNDGDVAIGDKPPVELSGNAKKTYDIAAKNGVKESASDSTQLQEYMDTIIDSYIEQYIQSNPGMEPKEKSSLIAFIKSQGSEFVSQFTQNNKAVPYNTKAVASELMTKLDTAVAERKGVSAEVNGKLDDYKNNVDSNFGKLSETSDKADDDYVTGAEYKKMKEEATAYIMGMLLNGTEDADFLKGLNPDYKNSSGYKVAMAAIKAMEAESDPAKIKEYLEQAEVAVGKLIGNQNVDGSSKLNDIVNSQGQKKVDAQKAAQLAEYKSTISGIVDKLVESYSSETKTKSGFFRNGTSLANSEEQVQQYAAKLNNIMNAFLAQYKGDGKNIESEFNSFLDKSMQEAGSVMAELNNITAVNSADKYAELKGLVTASGTYASAGEKAGIVDKSVDFILNQLAQGIADISILKDVYPDYAKDTKFVEAQSLMSGIKTSATPKEDLAKIKQLLSEMMTTVGADKIIDGVKNKKMPAVSFDSINREALTSSIGGYDGNESLSSGYGKQNDGRLDEIQAQAKQKLEEVRSQLLSQLKSQLGADYDESKLNEMIDDAIYQTINQFSDNIQRTRKSSYSTDIVGFEFCRRSGTKSGRYAVNVKQLVDTFLTKFQELSAKASGEVDKTKNPVDKLDIMKDTPLADAYQDKKTSKYRSAAEAKLELKSQISMIAIQLKAKLKQQLGKDYNATIVENLIQQATTNIVNDGSAISQTRDHTNRFLGLFFSKGWDEFSVNTKTVADRFYDEFSKLYEESNKEKK